MKSRMSKERYVVEASFRTNSERDALKRLMRKPVSFSGGGNKKFASDIGWSFTTKRAALRAVSRLRSVGGATPRLIEL